MGCHLVILYKVTHTLHIFLKTEDCAKGFKIYKAHFIFRLLWEQHVKFDWLPVSSSFYYLGFRHTILALMTDVNIHFQLLHLIIIKTDDIHNLFVKLLLNISDQYHVY
jgi:hypothetical protein